MRGEIGRFPTHQFRALLVYSIAMMLIFAGTGCFNDSGAASDLELETRSELGSTDGNDSAIDPETMRSGMEAILLRQQDDLKRIVEADASLVKSADKYGYTFLNYAIQLGNEKAVQYLISAGSEIDRQDPRYGKTPLHGAIESNDEDIVRILLSHGADPSIRDKEGVSGVDLARKLDLKDLIELLEKSR
jgi:ankyrin repeat protein